MLRSAGYKVHYPVTEGTADAKVTKLSDQFDGMMVMNAELQSSHSSRYPQIAPETHIVLHAFFNNSFSKNSCWKRGGGLYLDQSINYFC